MSNKIKFTRVNNDVNGNPRYVFHFLNLITDKDNYNSLGEWVNIGNKYNIALQRAKEIGGKKFHNKQYGGGIVIQSYNIQEDERRILEIVKKYN